MRIRFNMIKYAMAMMCMVLVAACSEDDDWQAGPEAKAGNQQVHFSGTNETFCVLDDTDPNDRTVTLTVERNTSEGALTVPVKVEKQSEGIAIQNEVKFEEGQQTATLEITVVGEAQKGTNYEYQLLLDTDEADPYAQLDGGIRWSGNISFPLPRRAKMYIADSSGKNLIGYWNATVDELGGGTYRINDLMNTGMDLTIRRNTSNNELTLSSSWWYDYDVEEDLYYPGCYYYYCNYWDAAADDYIYYPFYPHGEDAYVNIEQLVFYTGDGYSMSNNDGDYFYLMLSTLKLNTETSGRYWTHYLCFEFVDDDDIFDDYLPEQSTEKAYPTTPGDYSVTMQIENYSFNAVGDTWNSTLTVNTDGTYSLKNWMDSGMDLNFTIDDSGTYPNIEFSSPQLTDESIEDDPDYGAYYYHLGTKNAATNGYDFYKFYPYGTGSETYIEEMSLYMGSNYYSYVSGTGKFYFQTSWLKLSSETRAYEWYYITFTVDQ